MLQATELTKKYGTFTALNALDPQASNEFSELLLDTKERGVTTLMATRGLFRAKDTGTRIGIIKES